MNLRSLFCSPFFIAKYLTGGVNYTFMKTHVQCLFEPFGFMCWDVSTTSQKNNERQV